MHRSLTRPIFVKNVQIGGQNKVVIQSMTTTKTKNITETLAQISELAEYGCEIVRVAVFEEADADALKEICLHSPIPVVADIHFNANFALKAIENGIHKIRINPGNIGSEENVKQIIAACKLKNVPIRIGVNSGSLPKDLLKLYGRTAICMVESAKRHVEILKKYDFNHYAISLKASDPKLAIEAYELASETFDCPLHLGITEAGSLLRGTVKSSAALGNLLEKGIGDTIRVSLSADPINEVIVAKELLSIYGLCSDFPNLISCPTCGRLQYQMFPVVNEIEQFLNKLKGKVTVAIMGCVVNGPGEAAHADISLVGGKDIGILYVNQKIVAQVPQHEMVDALKKEILKYLNK